MLFATAKLAMESNIPSGWHLSSSSCEYVSKRRGKGNKKKRSPASEEREKPRSVCSAFQDGRKHGLMGARGRGSSHLHVSFVQSSGDDEHDVVDHVSVGQKVQKGGERFRSRETRSRSKKKKKPRNKTFKLCASPRGFLVSSLRFIR